MKLISVNLSNNCIKDPKCSFCYLNGKDEKKSHYWNIYSSIEKYKNENPTICFEYNGYNLGVLFKLCDLLKTYPFTMTTMPQVITPVFCSAMKSCGIEAISISFDSEKVIMPSINEWTLRANIARNAGLKVGCNYLIEGFPFFMPKSILESIDQLNILSLKPTGQYTEKELRLIELERVSCCVPFEVA